ncbi:MAG: MiaB/RimO family radical SAM methylthiotransferase, partial [Rhodospirillaceae bacterium]
AQVTEKGGRLIDTDFPVETKFEALPRPEGEGPTAFLSIQEGCDKFCTFCVVPYTRGAEYSRPVADIVAEAKGLVARGVREVTLLGQNVNAYHGLTVGGAEAGLGDLLQDLAGIEGLERLRYTTSHPRDVDAALIAAHRDIPQVVPFLHLPVQSGSDRILAAMNRGHDAASYRAILADFRAARPEMMFSSDFIVGFPGETEEDFQDTLRLAEEVGFIQAYSFKYSPRPGTPAAGLEDQVAEDVKADRLARLQKALTEAQTAFNRSLVGAEMTVLFDRPGRHPGQLVGRSPFMQPVHVTAPPEAIGSLHRVRVVQAMPNSLAAELIPDGAGAKSSANDAAQQSAA